MTLKVVLLAYRRGLISSRSIARACEQNVQFMAISGDSRPSDTHIAEFVRNLADQIQPLVKQVLMICDAQGLIGKVMFAFDGVKLPSNASKHYSGTHAELKHQAAARSNAYSGVHGQYRRRVNDDTNPIQFMRQAIDSVRGGQLYSHRMGTVEPEFANIRCNKKLNRKQLNRFTLRGKAKVSTQWRLDCLVHNIEKIVTVGLR